MSENPTQGLFMVKREQGIKRVLMPKADVATYLGSQVVDLEVAEGTSMEEVMQKLAEKYRLFLVPGVDYSVGNSRVVFGDQVTLSRTVPILKDSVSMRGVLTFTLRQKGKCDKPDGILRPSLERERTQLALISTVFSVEEGQYLTGNQLTREFSETVLEYLTALKLEVMPTLEDLAMGEVIDVLQDGVSKVLALKDFSGNFWCIRFALPVQEAVPETEASEDTE
jgi:hypothetical protein